MLPLSTHCFATLNQVVEQLPSGQVVAYPDEPFEIGSRREPLVDRFLIDRLQGDAQLQLHKPVPQ